MKDQPIIGFIFALITAMAWGSLPVALKQVLTVMNSQSIIFYRFWVAAIILLIILALRGKLPKKQQFNRYYVVLIFIGIMGLAGNFFLFNSSLNYVEPAIAQIFIHLSSFVMLICGVIVFKEALGLHQKIGLVILIIGLGLFFNDRFDLLFGLNVYAMGILASISAALVWVAYGMAQKLMLRNFTAPQILLIMYLGCAIIFTPFAQPSQVSGLTGISLLCFIYCCLNTLIGYGAYAEALNRWEVSKVSVVITLVPLFTILFSHLLHSILPDYFADPKLNTLSYVGAMVVVLGAMLSAIGHKFIKTKQN
ncbi:DMT family transporter [Volucribacter amazonae]|uniref:Transporter n=1 Tax=Volucribacter amazonae TaxID=256731 RepID=A0A9X4PAI2_9PAST|nr:DMT family transporter [Volucribacter amazonae]MDG6894697.1 transporter [Volucribacter amazonae]